MSVTAEIFLICTNVTRTNVAWTNVTVTVRAVRPTGKAQPEGRLGLFEAETGNLIVLSNPLGIIVIEIVNGVELEPFFFFTYLTCDWLSVI